jgi:hypothetical protein
VSQSIGGEPLSEGAHLHLERNNVADLHQLLCESPNTANGAQTSPNVVAVVMMAKAMCTQLGGDPGMNSVYWPECS